MRIVSRTNILRIRTPDGRDHQIGRRYPAGVFCVHRIPGMRGWTITHSRTRQAVIVGLHTKRAAMAGAAEFERLSDKWNQLHGRRPIWIQAAEIMNLREQFAIVMWHTDLQLREGVRRLWAKSPYS